MRIGEHGVNVFEVLEIDGDHATIQSVQDAPGRYPWPMRIQDLVPVE
ncbi:hypothetical protein ABIA39_001260 [Nocardia sp. GAS34]